jgi:hypothetical protein
MSEGTTLEHDLPDAGWYTDPENPRLQRYWGGKEWTHHVRHSDGVALTTQPTFVAESQPAPSPATFAQSEFSATASYAPLPRFLAQPSYSTTPAFSPVLGYPSSTVQSFAPMSSADRIAIEEPERAAYVPMSTIHHAPRTTSQPWGIRYSSPNSVPVWIVALSPLLSIGAQFLASTFAPESFAAITSAAVAGTIVFVLIVSGIWDAMTLRNRNLPSASPLWMLLTPIAFLGVRQFVLRREGFRFAAPTIVFGLCVVAAVAVAAYLLGIW